MATEGPRRITASTNVVAVIGSPVAHSLSPDIHNAAFEALGLDWVYVAFDVADGAEAVRAARSLGIEGLSVTMPHKHGVIEALDEVAPSAGRLGAVNTVHRVGSRWHGANTDGPGFVDALRDDEGVDPAGRPCVVVGAGGAARAVILALAEAGASEIVVLNRTSVRATEAAALAGDAGRVGREDDIADADIVVHATPAGMAGVLDDTMLVDPGRLHAGQVVVDLVYHPLRTPLLAAAREKGAVAVTGLGMLVHQAAHAFRLWTGENPPLEVMSAAAMRSLV